MDDNRENVIRFDQPGMRMLPSRNGICCPMDACLLRIQRDLMYEHVYFHHHLNFLKMNTETAGISCSKTVYLNYNYNTFYNFVLHAEDLSGSLFCFKYYSDHVGKLTITLQVINPTPSTQYFYELSLHYPGNEDPLQSEGMIQEYSDNRFFFPACRYDRRWFPYFSYFQENMLSERRIRGACLLGVDLIITRQ